MSKRNESMRIAGNKVNAEGVIDVCYPYTEEVIGSVPAGNAKNAQEAFDIAYNFKPNWYFISLKRTVLKKNSDN